MPGGALFVQGMTVSPTRAAGFPSIRTVALPMMILPSLVGGTPGAVPGGVGTWGGTFCSPLPSTAAGLPPINTVVEHPSVIVPAYGCGKGVGTGEPGGAGTRTMCVHTPGALSPSTAAGPVGMPSTLQCGGIRRVTRRLYLARFDRYLQRRAAVDVVDTTVDRGDRIDNSAQRQPVGDHAFKGESAALQHA